MSESLKKGKDCIGVGVTFFCHDGAGRFVMGRRGKHARDEHGTWELGSGGIEFGENAADAVRREVREEYGATALACEFLGYFDVHRVQEGAATHWISLVFKVLVDPADVRNNEPHACDEVRWFTRDTVPPDDELHSQFPKFRGLFGKEVMLA